MSEQQKTLAAFHATAADQFHAHLDVCTRCERQPFNLCAVGAQLLAATVGGSVDGSAKGMTGLR